MWSVIRAVVFLSYISTMYPYRKLVLPGAATAARNLPWQGRSRAVLDRYSLLITEPYSQRSKDINFLTVGWLSSNFIPLGFCHAWGLSSLLPRAGVSSTRRISGLVTNQSQNRYERFRQCLRSQLQTADEKERENSLMAVAKSTMEMLSANRRAFNRTWARMSPLMQLVVEASLRDYTDVERNTLSPKQQSTKLKSIADVGCDHGLLSLSLACMAWKSSQSIDANKENNTVSNEFLTSVIGSDVSSKALNGALLSMNKIHASLENSNKNIPVDFRVGNGLSTLQPGEADGVILAGMGINTMIDILTGDDSLDLLGTNDLFLQPTNSRPRHLLMLYEALQSEGHSWVLIDENITYLGGRWYINSHFKRWQSGAAAGTASFCFPGHFLNTKTDDSRVIYHSYVAHHIEWLKQNYMKKGRLEMDDRRWILFLIDDHGGDWVDACGWYESA